MNTIKPAAIAAATKSLHDEVSNVIAYCMVDTTLTTEGKKQRANRAFESLKYGGNLTNLRQALDVLKAGVDLAREQEIKEQMPEASSPMESVAAELSAARVLKRPALDGKALKGLWEEMGVGAARTVAFKELVARGEIGEDYLEGLLSMNSPYLATTLKESGAVQSFTALVTKALDAVDVALQAAAGEGVLGVQELPDNWGESVDDLMFDAGMLTAYPLEEKETFTVAKVKIYPGMPRGREAKEA